MYNYQHFIHLVNKAIQSAWDNLKSNYAISGAGGTSHFNAVIGNPSVPVIDYDPGTNRVFLTADDKMYNSETNTSATGFHRLKIFFNDRLYELFASLPYRLISNLVHAASLQTFSGRVCPWYSIRFIDRYNNKFVMTFTDPTDATKTLSVTFSRHTRR